MAESTTKHGDKVSVNFGRGDNRQGTVERLMPEGRCQVQLDNGRTLECIQGSDGKLHPFQPKQRTWVPRRPSFHSDNEAIDMIIAVFTLLVWLMIIAGAIVIGFFRVTSRTISRPTADRYLSLYAMLGVAIVLAAYSLKQANQWSFLTGGMRFLTVGEFVVWLGGLSAVTYLFVRRIYPFDIEETPTVTSGAESSG